MRSIILKMLPWSWAFIWFMIVFSLKGSMLAIWIFTLLVLLQSIFHKPTITRKQASLVIIPGLLFLWYLLSWIVNKSPGSGIEVIIGKSALLLLPLLLLLSQNLKGVNLNQAMRGLILALVLSGIHLLTRVLIMAINGHAMHEWTYHGFTTPYESGAIYYSWYISIALLYLMFGKKDPLLGKYYNYLILFMLLLLLAASSRLFVLVMIPILLWHIIGTFVTRKIRILFLIAISALIIGGSLPFLNRLQELGTIDLEIVRQEQFTYDTPLNGITLRLIQWRFGLEIMHEEQIWFLGAGPGNTQKLLDQKYLSHGIYTGNPELGDRGYLGYNLHNQYLETLLSAGLPALLVLLLLLINVIVINRKILIFPTMVFLITFMFFITESVLERQAGILVFSMMIVFSPDRKQ